MKNSEIQFCKTYNEFFGDDLSNIDQLKMQQFSGHELYEFCKYFCDKRYIDSGLKHFYSRHKSIYLAFGFVLGIVIYKFLTDLFNI